MNLNILVLHRMGDPKNRREAVRTLEYMIPEHLGSERYNCFVHDASLPLPDQAERSGFTSAQISLELNSLFALPFDAYQR